MYEQLTWPWMHGEGLSVRALKNSFVVMVTPLVGSGRVAHDPVVFSLSNDVLQALPFEALGVGLFPDLLDLAVQIVRHGFKHVH